MAKLLVLFLFVVDMNGHGTENNPRTTDKRITKSIEWFSVDGNKEKIADVSIDSQFRGENVGFVTFNFFDVKRPLYVTIFQKDGPIVSEEHKHASNAWCVKPKPDQVDVWGKGLCYEAMMYELLREFKACSTIITYYKNTKKEEETLKKLKEESNCKLLEEAFDLKNDDVPDFIKYWVHTELIDSEGDLSLMQLFVGEPFTTTRKKIIPPSIYLNPDKFIIIWIAEEKTQRIVSFQINPYRCFWSELEF
mmetsp:Transcript_52804/g.64703  ORF Transcript_52804/g.64703 Transcript_52804/m.64703 type:complete len:249 (-) Transcript_52804:69-815(-)